MLSNLLEYLPNTDHQQTIGWICGGIVVVIGAAWTVFTFFFSKKDEKKNIKQDISSNNGSIAIGGNVSKSPINVANKSNKKI